ncbi:Sec63 Brl domain-containing protein [Kalaharituber pfeilii]|nr:Sec63 Brl domain-containing protein [Kalaharituber pfeilii]
MSREYNYDNEGQFFPYFVLTLLGLILAPLTYSTFAPSKSSRASKIPLVQTGFVPPNADLIKAARRRQAKRERRLKRFISIVLGWGLFAYMVYLIVTTTTKVSKIWDPYEILGISTSASEKDIKKHYRKLAMQYHPDKVTPAGNETMESLNDRYVEMTKAYKVLTDEEVRNNYILYGHPDGRQSTSIGIALPQWIVAAENIYYVLAAYGFIFGIVLPYTVGKWWYGTKKHTKDGVLTESAGSLFKAYDQVADERRLVEILPLGEEYKDLVAQWGNIDDAFVESKLEKVIGEKSFKRLQEMEPGPRRKALSLLWAYLYRVDFGSEKLENAKLDTAPPATALNNSFLSIALAYGSTAPILASMHVSQSLIQAIAPGDSPLLQLPAFTPAVAAAVEQDGGKNHWTIQRFMALPEQRRRQLCIGKGLLTESEYNQAIAFAKKLPALKVEAAFFKVAGEKFVTVSSLVQFVVKARIAPPGADLKPVDEKDLADEDPDEGDVDALIGRKPRWSQTAAKTSSKLQPNPLAHAPYYPRDYSPRWHLFLADAKQGKMVIPPTTFSQLEKTEEGGIETLKLQFQAPPQKGEYTFVMHLVNDAYLGMDTKMNVRMVVEGPEKVMQLQAEEDEISEPDEDSIAGQMNAMRGGAVKKKKVVTDSDDDEDEEESDTDGEKVQDDSETDTDTDTDEE